MRAEDQSMLIEEAQGQQTVQAIFVQTGERQHQQILNLTFEPGPDGKLSYVFSGTAEHYMQFRQLMEDHGVRPAHEIEGHPANPNTPKADDAAQAPVIDTAPAQPVPDTLTAPAELSVTDGEVVTAAPEGASDEPAVRSAEQPADSGQPATGAGDQASGSGTGDQPHDGGGSGSGAAPGGNAGGEAASQNGTGTVDGQGVKAAADDPFAMLN